MATLLVVTAQIQAQQGENTPRSGRKDKPQQTAPVKQQPNAQNKSSQNNTGQNATGKDPNRNEDRAIGNKNESLMQVDTARGTGTNAPYAKTPDAVKEKLTPDGATNNTNTPNSMNATPITPDASSSYNPASNSGVGENMEQLSDTFHYMDQLNTNIPSAKGGMNAGSGGANTTTSPARGEANTGGSTSTNATGKTKMGTTGTGFSTGANAGENAGNTSPGTNASNRTNTTTDKGATQKKGKKDPIR